MKKLLLSLLILLEGSNCLYAQTPHDSLVRLNLQGQIGYYKKKAHDQKIAGIVLGGGGVLLSAIGAGIGLSSGFLDFSDGQSQSNFGGVGGVLVGLGGLSFIASLPVLFASLRNSNKAKLLLREQTTSISQSFRITQTTVGLAIRLGR